MAMQDLGEKPGDTTPAEAPKVYYPSLVVKNEYGPEWSEEPFEAKVKLKFTGFDKSRDQDTYNCHFDVLAIDLSKAPYKDEEEPKKADWQIKDRAKEMGMEE